MKTTRVVVIAALAGAALGGGMSWAKFANPPPFALSESVEAAPADQHEHQPKVSVDARIHDFGPVDRDMTATHVFRITNSGTAPLTLKSGNTTCSRCTIAHLSKSELQPGETADVTIDYLPTIAKPHFRQVAMVHTNDPNERRVELTIIGRVTSRYRVVPEDLSFSKVSTNESKTAELRIYSFRTPEVRVAKHEFLEESSAPYFEVKCEPIPPDQLKEPEAQSGCIVAVTVKPGLPLGTIRQTIRLELALGDSSDSPVVEVPIYGRVDTDISIVGTKDWTANLDLLKIGEVKSAQGAKRELFLVLRGSKRHGVKFSIAKLDPPWLRVTFGEPIELKKDGPNESGVTQIPLTVEIPPGAPPVNHLGSEVGKHAEIVLESTHPQVKQILMFLQFVVEQ